MDVVMKSVKGVNRKGGKKNRKHGRSFRAALHRGLGTCSVKGCARLRASRTFNTALGVYVTTEKVIAFRPVPQLKAAETVR